MNTFRTAIASLGLCFAMSNASAAVIGMGNNSWYTDTLRSNLVAQGHTVKVLNSYDAATLAGFDAYIQDGNSYFNAALLDQFVFKGGTLIEVPWTFTHNSYTAGTKVFGSRTNISYSSDQVRTIDAGNWLLDGVTLPVSVTAGHELGNTFNADTTRVLSWADGTAMLGYKEYGQGIAIGLNLHLITSDSKPLNATWSNQIVFNAIQGEKTGEVPEPASLALVGISLLGLGLSRKIRNRA